MNVKRFARGLLVAGLLALGCPGAEATRAMTIGWEIGLGGSNSMEGVVNQAGAGAATLDASVKRSGASSLKCDSGATVGGYAFTDLSGGTNALFMSVRVYSNFTAFPTATVPILRSWEHTGPVLCYIAITSTGTLQLWDSVHNVQVGSDSSALSLSNWDRVEMSISTSGANTNIAGVLNGSTFASGTIASFSNGISTIFDVGWCGTSPGTGKVANFDDFAVNTDGAVLPAYPGSGKIILLKPISDNARTGWTTGAAGTTSLFSAVSNTPPKGSSTETATSQVKDTVSSATNNYDANMQSYTTGGLVSTDTVTLVQAVIDQGENSISLDSGAMLIVSNPVQSAEDTFVYGTGTAIGVWPTEWTGHFGTAQVGNIAAGSRGTSPVMRIGKRTATTREVDVDFMGIMVEYTNAAAAVKKGRRTLLGVGF